jgi:predicted phosphodiesterase
MKLDLCSDMHLEFDPYQFKNRSGAQVLVLCGDVVLAKHIDKYRSSIQTASQEYQNVVAIAGNHEFYGMEWHKTHQVLQEFYSAFPNVHYLNNQACMLDGVWWYGSTMWTHIPPPDQFVCERMMQDYRLIKYCSKGTYRKLRASDTSKEYHNSIRALQGFLDKHRGDKVVVLSHHAPTHLSVHPQYSNNALNVCYHNHLGNFILGNPQVQVWLHGHTHHEFDYLIGNTRVVCNPRGYVGYERGEQAVDPFYTKTIELS